MCREIISVTTNKYWFRQVSKAITSYLLQFQCLWKPFLNLNRWSASLHWVWTWCSFQWGQSYNRLHRQIATGDQMAHCQCAIFEPGKSYINQLPTKYNLLFLLIFTYSCTCVSISTWLNWTGADSPKTSQMMTDLIAIEDVRQFICSQFSVRADIRTCPAHSHLPCGHRLELKVPFSLGDSVRLLCPEDSYLVPPSVLKAMASYREKGKVWQKRLRALEMLLSVISLKLHSAYISTRMTYCSPDLEARCCSHSQWAYGQHC